MTQSQVMGDPMVRGAASFVYLAGTGLWLLVMAWDAAWRCDDACVSAAHADSWRNYHYSWQWEVNGWLGLAGAVLALMAVLGSWIGRKIGLGLLAAHASVVVANLVVLVPGIDFSVNGWGAGIFGMLVVFWAGLIAVGGLAPDAAGGDTPAGKLDA